MSDPGASFLERQRALLERMLSAMRDQRRCLVASDAAALEQVNRELQALLELQAALTREAAMLNGAAEAEQLSELRRVAAELSEESRLNHALACRQLQYLDFSLGVLSGCDQDGARPGEAIADEGAGAQEPLPASGRSAVEPQLFDTRR